MQPTYQPNAKLDLSFTRVVNVPRALVWRAWTKASPSGVQGTLAKLGQMVDKAASKELASDGRISSSMSALSSNSSLLRLQQSALLKVAQQYASMSSSSPPVSSVPNFYKSGA